MLDKNRKIVTYNDKAGKVKMCDNLSLENLGGLDEYITTYGVYPADGKDENYKVYEMTKLLDNIVCDISNKDKKIRN